MRRVGHKGADLIAPGNTASFDAALEAGVDMIEFDVLPEHVDGPATLFLAHDYEDLAPGARHDARGGPRPPRRRRASRSRARRRPQAPRLRAARGRRAARAASPSARSSRRWRTRLAGAIRALAPEIRLGWSVPQLRRNYPFDSKLTLVPGYALRLHRRRCPRRRAAAIEPGASTRSWPTGRSSRRGSCARCGGRRRALRVDRRRRPPHRAARAPRRHRGHHERPAAVRSADLAGRARSSPRRRRRSGGRPR